MNRFEEAQELFGSKKRVEARVAKQRVDNETASKIQFVINRSLKPELIRFLNEAKSIVMKEYNRKDCEWLANATEIINGTIISGEESVIFWGDMPVDDDEDNFDAVHARLKTAVSKLNDRLEKYTSPLELSKLFYFEPFVDEGLEIYIQPRSDARGYLLSKFSSFDSFMYDIATEGFKETAGKVAGVLSAAAFAGIFLAASAPFIAVAIPILGVAAAGALIGNKKRAQEITYAQNNPSPEEEASLAVFESKYESKMKQHVAELQKLFKDAVSDSPKMASAIRYDLPASSKNTPMTKLCGFICTIDRDKFSRDEYRDFIEMRKPIHEKFDELNDKLANTDNGLFVLRRIQDGAKTHYFIFLDWVDKNGVILPNLR